MKPHETDGTPCDLFINGYCTHLHPAEPGCAGREHCQRFEAGQVATDRRELTARIEELETALENARLFANLVECWGRTDCEIYKHELKASADLSLGRIESVLPTS